MSETLRVACVQVTSTPNIERNIELTTPLIREAHGAGAQFITLPEIVNLCDMNGDAARATAQSEDRDPALAAVYARLDDPIGVPTRVLCGEMDMRKEMLPRQADLFTGQAQYGWGIVPDAGHFLHRERPELVNREIADWLSAGDRGSVGAAEYRN